MGWSLAASLGVAACTGSIGGDDTERDGAAEAASGLCVVDTPLRRLTRFEYDNTVRDLLGDDTRPAMASLPPEEQVAGFDNQAAALTVSDLLAEQYLKVAEEVSERAVADMPSLFGRLDESCDAGADGEETCGYAFIDAFATRAYRRPLEDEERERLTALFDGALADGDLGYATGLRMVIEAVLQSPYFLYRPEFGHAVPVAGDVVALTSWEMASKLSYMLWNSMPDEALFAAAERDELRTPDQIADQARRMLKDDRARDAIRNFHEQWLLLTELDTVSKDTDVYPEYRDALRPLWKEEVEQFVEHTILDGEGTLEALFTSSTAYMNEELATFYGDDVLDPPTGEDFQAVSLDPTRRAGLLTQGAVMAMLAGADHSSPVFRGKFVREQLMCQSLPLPPNDLVIEPPELDSSKTTREQFEEIGADPDCRSCHLLMNPIGFGFENYDAVGKWRDTQSGKPIDASGEVVNGEDLEGTFDGAVELAQKLAASEQVATCVASQYFRFSYNRTVTAEDSCNLEPVMKAFAESDYDIRELIVALTQTDSFLFRHQVIAGGTP